MIKLDILSDPVCPWCYIGKARLERALEAHPEHQFVIEWHPFQLNPEMPEAGMDRREYLETKFGSKESVVRVHAPMVKIAEEIGLPLDLGAIKRAPNTLNAHRLIHWAGLEGKQNAVVDRLFKANFVEGRDISDKAVLTDIASSAGLDGAAIGRLLDSDADAQDIRARDANARERGIGGVPCFIIANKYAVSGAQPTEFWENVIAELAGKAEQPAV